MAPTLPSVGIAHRQRRELDQAWHEGRDQRKQNQPDNDAAGREPQLPAPLVFLGPPRPDNLAQLPLMCHSHIRLRRNAAPVWRRPDLRASAPKRDTKVQNLFSSGIGLQSDQRGQLRRQDKRLGVNVIHCSGAAFYGAQICS